MNFLNISFLWHDILVVVTVVEVIIIVVRIVIVVRIITIVAVNIGSTSSSEM
jgi:hypothetical protein